MRRVSPQQVKTIIQGDGEYALLDVRERNPFSKAHLMQASCAPLSQLELIIGDLVPRLATPIIVMGEGLSDKYRLAQRACARLAELGYSDLSIMEGGVKAWADAGFELFSGVGSYSKAFGEWVAVKYNTPHITPDQEQEMIKRGEKFTLLDCRPKPEYQNMTIPGSTSAPGADLVYRVQEAVKDDKSLVVVHCAGRTRSIIGTQSLVNAGIPNPVVALENGTMGWQLAGYELEYGQTREAPIPTGEGLQKAKQVAERMARRFGVKKVSLDTVRQWQAEAEQRTLYLIDVRLPEEYQAGHWAQARNVQGGQLVQATDEFISVFNSRVVLIDDTEVRATVTASWLIQLGWEEAYVLENGLAGLPLVKGPWQAKALGLGPAEETISPRDLQQLIKAQGDSVAVVDLGPSPAYKQAHIPGAWWGIRSQLELDLAQVKAPNTLVLTSGDGKLAHLALRDLQGRGLPIERLLVLEGGSKAWTEAGLPSEAGMVRPLCEADDVWYMPYMHPDAPDQAKRDYFAWELGLVEQVARDGTAKFRFFPVEE